VAAVGDDGQGEPLAVIADDPPGRDAAVDGPRAEVGRLGAVAVLEAVLDLGLVAVLVLAGDAAEEEPAVEGLAVGLHLGLQDEVRPLSVAL
jgi:hypothetical protein